MGNRTSSPAEPDLSDKNCEKTCGLQYGISQVFGQNVLEKQKIRASKAHVKPNTFTDRKDKKYHRHMLDDVMLKHLIVLTSKNIPKIFRGDECKLPGNFERRGAKHVLLPHCI